MILLNQCIGLRLPFCREDQFWFRRLFRWRNALASQELAGEKTVLVHRMFEFRRELDGVVVCQRSPLAGVGEATTDLGVSQSSHQPAAQKPLEVQHRIILVLTQFVQERPYFFPIEFAYRLSGEGDYSGYPRI